MSSQPLAKKAPLLIDMWSDIVCPFCTIGKRKLDMALADLGFTLKDAGIDTPMSNLVDKTSEEKVAYIRYHAFQLEPESEKLNPLSLPEHLSRKFGQPIPAVMSNFEGMAREAKSVGLEFDFRNAKVCNTFDAHRLLHFAQEDGQAAKYGESIGSLMKDRLLKGYFTDSLALGDEATLQKLAVEVGMDADEVAKVLGDKKMYADAVRADEAKADRMGIHGVPFFLLNESIAIDGSRAPTQMKQLLLKAMGKL